jgi:calcineurin-like phosphoesterase family protein
MNNLFFTADTHFDHANIIKYCNRPFSSLKEMNDSLIENWNHVVKPEDIVYFLGDFAFHRPEYFANVLNGHKRLVIGSHDKDLKSLYRPWAFEEVSPLKEINVGGQSVTLCHYAMRRWLKSHYGAWHLYGHSHGNLPPIGKSWDVGVDNNNFAPLSWQDIVALMKDRPCNDENHVRV